MSHTVVLDEAERDRRMVNHLNEILRHCRVGRVRPKRKPTPFMPGRPFDGWKPADDDWYQRKVVPTFASDHTADVPLLHPSYSVL